MDLQDDDFLTLVKELGYTLGSLGQGLGSEIRGSKPSTADVDLFPRRERRGRCANELREHGA